jgi:predicted Zn finger-like uncharacterized protein
MYTQCPDCNAAFLVTADDLKRAAGKVRCGGCDSAFDALKYLSESLPDTRHEPHDEITPPELKPTSRKGKTLLPESIYADESIALLQTLDELAGSNIRIEDTGIEWRVLDDIALAELPMEDGRGDAATLVAEVRYDDNSPLPERLPAAEDAPETPEEPVQDAMPDEPVDGDDEFSETLGWEEIVDEFDDLAASNIEKVELDEEQLAGDGDELDEADDDNEPAPDTDLPAEDEAEPESPGGIDGENDDNAEFDPDGSPSQWQLLDEDDDQEDPLPTLRKPIKLAAGPMTERITADGGDGLLIEEGIVGVESIVMEGDSVRYALDDMEAAAFRRAVDSNTDSVATNAGSAPHPRSTARRIGMIVAAVLLLLTLAAQVVHQQRQTLAKNPAVNSLIGPLYRALGNPLVPAWDVTGWSFEATTGNANGGDQQLSIYSRIANRSDEALPYPLIGISLTDRFEEIIGSRMLEAGDYLANSLNPRKMVAPGEAFDAFITVPSPSAMASGYKLDVCYRLPDRRLRCAIGDFK